MNPPFVEQVADGCGAGQLAPVSGPVLGGLLIDTWGWRGAFLVNIPIVLIVLILTWRWFPADEQRGDQPLDAVDLFLLPISAPGLGGRAGLRVPGLFGDRSFRGAIMMMSVLGVTTWGPMLLLPLHFQQLRGLSALDAGFALAPQSVGLGPAFLVVGRYPDRVAPRPVAAAGLAVATVATVPFLFATAHSDLWVLGLALFVRGLGLGVASLPVSVALHATLRPSAIAGATSASTVVQRVGAADGTAPTAVVLQARGFTSAFTWMPGCTGAACAASALLAGRVSRMRRAAVRFLYHV